MRTSFISPALAGACAVGLLAALTSCDTAPPSPAGTPVKQVAVEGANTRVFDSSLFAAPQDDPLVEQGDLAQLVELVEKVCRNWPGEMQPDEVSVENGGLRVRGSFEAQQAMSFLVTEFYCLEENRHTAGNGTQLAVTPCEVPRSLAEAEGETAIEPGPTGLVLKLYPIASLLSQEQPLQDRATLQSLAMSIANPLSWEDVGGRGSLQSWRGVLAVLQTAAMHQELEETFEILALAKQMQTEWENRTGPLPDPEPLRLNPLEPQNELVLAALDKKGSFHFQQVTLAELAANLSRDYGIQVVVDQADIADAGLGDELALSCDLDEVSLRSFLRIVLRHYDLTYTVHDGQLVITTPQEVEPHTVTILYPSYDLVDSNTGLEDTGLGDTGFEDIAQLMVATVAPTQWDEVGGIGCIDSWNGSLVISQAEPVHAECEELWRQLRAGRQLMQAWDGVTPPPPCPMYTLRRDDFSLRQNLRQQVDLPEQTLALGELATLLKEKLGCETRFDPRLVDDGAIDLAAQLEFGGAGLLADVLREDLQPHGLTFLVENEVLWIEPGGRSREHIGTKIYPVFDLTALPAEQGQSRQYDPQAMQALLTTISSTIAPQNWENQGGFGSLAAYGNGLLVVRQSDTLQREVERFLEAQRAEKATAPTTEAAE